MAVSALVVTAGSATANAYATRAFADQYHSDRPAVGTTWSAATNDQKDAAILFATKLLDVLFYWNGYVIDELQALMFPRYGLYKRNRITIVDPTTIPIEIQWATSEYARQLIASDITGDSAIESLGLTSFKVGPIAMTFQEEVYAKPVPDVVVSLIPPEWGYLLRSSGIAERELLRS